MANPNALGAILAGGAGDRLGGSKALVQLRGLPLIAYPLAAFAEAGIETVVVAKADTELPPLGVGVLIEPPEPHHPLLGVATVLAEAAGRGVVTCPCDTPFVTPALLARLASRPGAAAVRVGARLHPLLARYEPADLEAIRAALAAGDSATAAVEGLAPALIDADERTTFNVNTPADLELAEDLLGR